MKYFWPIIGLIVCVILFFNVDNKLFAWIGTPFFLVMMSSPEIAIHNFYRYGKSRKSRL